jgi:hypothetical protein
MIMLFILMLWPIPHMHMTKAQFDDGLSTIKAATEIIEFTIAQWVELRKNVQNLEESVLWIMQAAHPNTLSVLPMMKPARLF